MRQIRQGDVLVEQVKARLKTGRDISEAGRVILAHGEVTGHAHEVIVAGTTEKEDVPAAQFFEEPDGERYLFVTRTCTLVHEEHGAIALAPGCYHVTRQREYSPEAIRSVQD